MSFNDLFRISVHAVITNSDGQVLLLKATYKDSHWGLPGGSLEPEETVLDAIKRECKEETGKDIVIKYLSGIYYHKKYNSQAIIFRCEFVNNSSLTLSDEHSEFKYFDVLELSFEYQRQRVVDCLNYDGMPKSAKFE